MRDHNEPDARAEILGRIRKSLNATAHDTARQGAVAKRLASHPRGPLPARALGDADARFTQFKSQLEEVGGTVARLASRAEVPGHIAAVLRERNLPARLRMGADRYLAGLNWDEAPGLEREIGRASGRDAVGLARARAGAAETGTCFLASGPDNPTTNNFLPETHVIVLDLADLCGSYEEAWDRLRLAFGERTLPRTINLISGPSRTADIEQTIVRGAHGPKELHVIVVG